jgi:hypothetical protein
MEAPGTKQNGKHIQQAIWKSLRSIKLNKSFENQTTTFLAVSEIHFEAWAVHLLVRPKNTSFFSVAKHNYLKLQKTRFAVSQQSRKTE